MSENSSLRQADFESMSTAEFLKMESKPVNLKIHVKTSEVKRRLLYFNFFSKRSTSDIVDNGPPLSWMLSGEVPAYRANRATLPHPPMHISGSCGQKSNYLIYSCIYLCARATEEWLPNTSIQTCLKSGKSKYQRAMKINKMKYLEFFRHPWNREVWLKRCFLLLCCTSLGWLCKGCGCCFVFCMWRVFWRQGKKVFRDRPRLPGIPTRLENLGEISVE